ncbi:MAG: hypothetical protein GXO17_06260 [Thermodesulfobacteria bacterium]|nr:hypothetical protein [Thermodesulfobacteriota bacterium]
MKNKIDEPKRSFIKQMLFAAGAVLAVGAAKKAKAKGPEREGDEILYRETEAFRAYYESLRD